MANISKVQLPSGGTYDLRDSSALHPSDYKKDNVQEGVILYGKSDGSVTLLIPASNGTVLVLSNGVPTWASIGATQGVYNGALKLQLNDGTAFGIFSANANSDKTISFKTGKAEEGKNINGTFIISDGTTETQIPIYFQDDSAAKVTVTSLNTTAQGYATAAQQAAENYAAGLVSGLGSVLSFKGVKSYDQIIALTSAKVGDVYVTSDGIEWVCTTAVTESMTSDAKKVCWEKLGANVDMSDYEVKSNLGDLAYKNSVAVSVTYKKVNANTGETSITPAGTISSAAPTQGETGNYTPTGTVEVSTTVTPSTQNIRYFSEAPTLPSFNASAADSNWSFSMGQGSGNTETLIIAGGNSTLKSNFNAGSIPTTTKDVVTGISSATSTGSFSGTATKLTFTGTAAGHTHTIGTSDATVNGTVTYTDKSKS